MGGPPTLSPERCDWGTGTIIGLRAVRVKNRKRWVGVRPVPPSPHFDALSVGQRGARLDERQSAVPSLGFILKAVQGCRPARVQIMAKVYGEIYHANAVVRELRNKILREWAGQGGIDMSWLYGEQPELPQVRSVPQPATTRLVS